jgi:hypothetical protein
MPIASLAALFSLIAVSDARHFSGDLPKVFSRSIAIWM